MADLVIPDSRFEQPELFYPNRKPVGNVRVNWDHPMTRGLTYSFLVKDNQFKDMVSGLNVPIFGGASYDIVKGEQCILFDGSTGYAGVSLDLHDFTDTTLVGRFLSNNDNNIGQGIVSVEDDRSASKIARLTAQMNVTGNPVRAASSNSTIFPVADSADAIVVNKWENAIGVYRPLVSVSVFFKNKKTVANETSSGAYPSQINFLSIGRWEEAVGGKQYLSGGISCIHVFDRALSDEEAISLNRDIFQFLEPV